MAALTPRAEQAVQQDGLGYTALKIFQAYFEKKDAPRGCQKIHDTV